MQNTPSSSKIPVYRRQREKGRSDRAYARIDGRKIHLGAYGSDESRQKYAELIAALPASAQPSDRSRDRAEEITVSELILAYLKHARRYYQTPEGDEGREYQIIVDVCRYVRREAGALPAREFGPKKLKAVRQRLIDRELSRRNINKLIDRVRRMCRWGAEEELIPATVPQALSMVAGLRKGRSDARETEPIKPVDEGVVEATLEHLPEVVADMVRVQLHTGMRPGELVIMRPQDIDRSGKAWLYRPSRHKTGLPGPAARGCHRSAGAGRAPAVPRKGPGRLLLPPVRLRAEAARRPFGRAADAHQLRQPARNQPRRPPQTRPRGAVHRRQLPKGDPTGGGQRGGRNVVPPPPTSHGGNQSQETVRVGRHPGRAGAQGG